MSESESNASPNLDLDLDPAQERTWQTGNNFHSVYSSTFHSVYSGIVGSHLSRRKHICTLSMFMPDLCFSNVFDDVGVS